MTGEPLPNAERAIVAQRKLVDYLLSDAHPDAHGVAESEATLFGVRYIAEGELGAPDGRRPVVRVVWFIRTGGDVPELVTAYPIRRRS